MNAGNGDAGNAQHWQASVPYLHIAIIRAVASDARERPLQSFA
jgi:hypothetical protein